MSITTTAPPGMPYADMERLAESIAKSGLFGIKTKDQAVVLMMIAHAEGRHPVEAARDYDIINGRPAKKAEAMMRDFIGAGGKVEWHSLTDALADATFTHPQTGSVRIDWDMKRAKTAFGAKDMYTKFPRQMLRSRVVSEGVRTLWPLATSGLYVPEEVAAFEGTTLEHEVTPPPAPPPPAPSQAPPDDDNDARWRAYVAKLKAACEAAESRADVVALGARDSVRKAFETGPAWVVRDVSDLLADGYQRFPDEGATDLGPVEIAGAANLAAG